jgi:L-asparagine oxygenase
MIVEDVSAVTITLEAEESGELAAVTRALADRFPDTELDDEDLLTSVQLAARALPERLAAELIRFRRYGNEDGTLVIRNVPIDADLIPTPGKGEPVPWQRVPVATIAQLAVNSLLGDVLAYADEKSGELVQDILPVPGAEQRQENTGSVLLELHTEDGFHPYKPDIISLLCLRSDHDRVASTVTGSIRRVLPELSDACVNVLRQPRFQIRTASSFGDDALSRPLPVLSGPVSALDLCVDFHAMEPMDRNAAWALDLLRDATRRAVVGMVLEPGDLIIVDNRVAVHGRTGFTPRYDGADRWLRRCFSTADLRRSRAARMNRSHVCAPLWAISGDVVAPRSTLVTVEA